ncbi:hypothetical protein, partial [Dolichospermum sp. UHCC 0259]|uniref:hypothetical protein n=1 Tax=Dolichospermum sp. UHCC 0259 TaxID=2590010 RepID=UPI001C2D353E
PTSTYPINSRKWGESEKLPDELFIKVAEGTGKIVFDKLAKGPRQRTDRLPRSLKTNETADIYKVILSR